MASGFEDYSRVVFTSASEEEQAQISATSTVTNHSFSKEVKFFLVLNDGPNAVHYKDGTGAVTTNQKIPSGAFFIFALKTSAISFICASGETATVYVTGLR